MAEEKLIGTVIGYYDHVKVIAIELNSALKVGDKIHIKGATTDFTQKIDSMQIEHEKVTSAKKGDSVGIKVKDKARKNDKVYKAE
ncbi:translation elongation factor-like protein [Candidatus Woesearchaeota archaeon]|nr:translation elongation factor-like protein [Candidatus Woesearchaeota archaeon]